MKDEIKEIITRINKEIEKHIKDGYSEDMLVIYELDVLQWRVLLDYITNLQERFDALLEAHKIADELETEYQERNEKAIEYMNNYIKVEESNEPVKIEFKVVRNILQGDDKK